MCGVFFIAIFAKKVTVLPRNVETTNRQKDVTKITNMRRKLQISVLFVNLNTQITNNEIQKSFIDNKIRYL